MKRIAIAIALVLLSFAPAAHAQDIRCAPVPYVMGQPPDPGPVPLYPPVFPTPPQVLYDWASLVQWHQFYESARAWTAWQQQNCVTAPVNAHIAPRAVEPPVPVYTGDMP